MEYPLMWSLWRDDKGIERALEEYYPETLKENPVLQIYLQNLKNAKSMIDQFMLEKQKEAQDELWEDEDV